MILFLVLLVVAGLLALGVAWWLAVRMRKMDDNLICAVDGHMWKAFPGEAHVCMRCGAVTDA